MNPTTSTTKYQLRATKAVMVAVDMVVVAALLWLEVEALEAAKGRARVVVVEERDSLLQHLSPSSTLLQQSATIVPLFHHMEGMVEALVVVVEGMVVVVVEAMVSQPSLLMSPRQPPHTIVVMVVMLRPHPMSSKVSPTDDSQNSPPALIPQH